MAKRGTIKKGQFRDSDARKIKWRKYPHLFLIVCEDQKTEPYYFNSFVSSFPDETVFLRTVGTGENWIGVVNKSIRERMRLQEESSKTVDETWAVFDVDDADHNEATIDRFQQAFRLAAENGIKVGDSNQVFELWLLLHFENVEPDSRMLRTEVYTRLENAIRTISDPEFNYIHGQTKVIDEVIRHGNEENAIKRAIQLIEHHGKRQRIDANPSTCVYVLVQRLRELSAWYSE